MTGDKTQYCQCAGNACPCGKSGYEILKCKLPMSQDRMAEIFHEMGEREAEEARERMLKLQ